jgi:hypothetical protein
MIRSDKMRRFTREEHNWFWDVQKISIKYEDSSIPFPDAWKHFDNGLSPDETVKIYKQHENLRPHCL